MKKILRISAKREGYRRCGVAHAGAATEHAIDAFNEKQIEILKADPMLIVQELDAGAAADTAGAKTETDKLLAEAKADRARAAEELKQAEADRKKAAGELAAAEQVRKEAEAAGKDAKPKAGKKG